MGNDRSSALTVLISGGRRNVKVKSRTRESPGEGAVGAQRWAAEIGKSTESKTISKMKVTTLQTYCIIYLLNPLLSSEGGKDHSTVQISNTRLGGSKKSTVT